MQFFLFSKSRGAVRCGFYFLRIVRCGAVRFSLFQNDTVRCGTVFVFDSPTVRNGADCIIQESYGAMRCGAVIR